MPVHDLGDVQNFVGQQVTDLLATNLALVLCRELDELQSHRPDLPGYALGLERKGPVALLFLKELERDLARARTVGRPERLREAGNVSLEGLVQVLRRTADVGEVDEVAVDVLVAHCAHRIAALLFVLKLAQATVEQNTVKYARHRLVHLSTLHAQLE